MSFKGTEQSSLLSFDLRRRLAINIGLFHVYADVLFSVIPLHMNDQGVFFCHFNFYVIKLFSIATKMFSSNFCCILYIFGDALVTGVSQEAMQSIKLKSLKGCGLICTYVQFGKGYCWS